MFQNKKMIVILVLVMVVVLAANWNLIFGGKKAAAVTVSSPNKPGNPPSDPAPSKAATTPVKKKDKAEPDVPDTPADYPQMLILAQGQEWGTDPFGLTPEKKDAVANQPPQIKTAEEKTEKNNFQLESILITPVQSLAVINGQLLSEGDLFQEHKISKITRDKVVMRVNGGRMELKLKDSGIPMSYEKR